MKRLLHMPVVYLTLLFVLLILIWSALVRFPWFVVVGLLVMGVVALRSGTFKEEENK